VPRWAPPTATRWAIALIVASLPLVQPALASAGDDHLLAGAEAFRDGRYDRALVEFKVALRLGADDDTLWYVAATLVNLKRTDEALEHFGLAQLRAPKGRDGLLDYYEAVACYDGRLFHCAEERLARVGRQAGPRISGQADKLRAQLVPLFSSEPTRANVDWYVTRGKAALAGGKKHLATYELQEALHVAQRRPECHRCDEVKKLLAETRG
jgi:tetratricopeptide (TPR) repeat protein